MKNAQVSCAANDDGLSNMPLGVESMGSTFLLHFVFSVVALALATGLPPPRLPFASKGTRFRSCRQQSCASVDARLTFQGRLGC